VREERKHSLKTAPPSMSHAAMGPPDACWTTCVYSCTARSKTLLALSYVEGMTNMGAFVYVYSSQTQSWTPLR